MTPKPNPRTSRDYEVMLEEAVQWAQHEKYNRKILTPVFQRVPEANDIRADRLFWVGDVIEEIVSMAVVDNADDKDFRKALQRVHDAEWWKMSGKRSGRARQLEQDVALQRQVAGISGLGTPMRASDVIRERVHRKRARREYEAGDPARAREIERDFEENPPWVSKLLAESMVTLQAQVPPTWMPKFASTSPSRGEAISIKLEEYGCGAYGCVMPTLDSSIVMKLTSDPSEAKFATEIADTLPTQCVVRYHMAVQLKDAERHGREVFLLWRESAEDVGKIHKVVGMPAEKLIRAQHQAAVDAYTVLADDTGDIDTYLELMEVWKRRCMEMSRVPELEYVATGMLRAWNEKGVFISDTHRGNLGRCVRNGKSTWVITDPGNVVVSTEHADERGTPTKNPKRHKPSGELKPLWMYIRQRLRRARPDFLDALARLPDGREIEVEIVDIDADNKHVIALGRDAVRHRVPIADIWVSGTKDWGTLAIESDDLVQNPTVPKKGATRFFEQHAGAAYPAGMRPRDGRRYSARELAIAEYVLQEEHPDAVVKWYPDPDAGLHYIEEDVDEYFLASLEEPEGEQLDALGAIGDPDANYRRVIEAELAMAAWGERVEELAQQLHGRRGRPLRSNPYPGIDSEGAMRAMRGMVTISVRNMNATRLESEPVDLEDLALWMERVRGDFRDIARVLPESKEIMTRYMGYFADKELLTKQGSLYTLSAKALSYDNRNVARWPDFRARTTTQTSLFQQSFGSHELAHYIKKFIGNAWEIKVAHSHRMEISTDASEYALAIDLEERRDSQWPSVNTFVVSTQDPMARPIGAGPIQVPTELNVRARSWPYSPMEFVAMVLPFVDIYHP